MRISRALAVLTVPVALLAAGCSDDSDTADDTTTTEAPATTEAPDTTEAPATTEAPEASGTIVDIAAGNPDFSTLVDLVGKAGLERVFDRRLFLDRLHAIEFGLLAALGFGRIVIGGWRRLAGFDDLRPLR